MPKFYLYNTTDLTYIPCKEYSHTKALGVSHICLDSVFKKSIQAAEMEYIKNPQGNMLSITNTDSKKKAIKLDQNFRDEIFHIPAKKLKATQSNPIVMAITKRVKFTNQSPAYYRLLLMGDYFLIILISGIVYIEDENGEWFEMQRSLPAEAHIPKDKHNEETYTTRQYEHILEAVDRFSGLTFNCLGMVDIITEIKHYYNEHAKGREEKYYTGLANMLSIKNTVLFDADRWNYYVKREEKRRKRNHRRPVYTAKDIEAETMSVAMLDEAMMEDEDYEVDYSELDQDNSFLEEDSFSDELDEDSFSDELEEDM